MIELDLFTYLKADTTLYGLLSASATDSKIYPDIALSGKSVKVPYIIFSVASDLRRNEVMCEAVVSFNCVSNSHVTSRSIRDRLLSLLDHDDRIQDLVASSSYYIYSCWLSGGTSFIDNEIGSYHFVAVFTVLYGRIGFTTPSGTITAIDGLNKFVSFVYQGTVIDETYIREFFYFEKTVTIFKIGGYVQEAPTGAAIIVDLVKNGVEQSRLFTIPVGLNAPLTPITITDLEFKPTDKLDIKIKQVGSVTPGAGLQIDLYYR
jgi:hypothetical protein